MAEPGKNGSDDAENKKRPPGLAGADDIAQDEYGDGHAKVM